MQERGDVDLGARLLVVLEFINFELGFLSSLLGKGQNENLDDKYPENHCQRVDRSVCDKRLVRFINSACKCQGRRIRHASGQNTANSWEIQFEGDSRDKPDQQERE